MNTIFKREKAFKETFPIIKPEVEKLEGDYLEDMLTIYESGMLTNYKWTFCFEEYLSKIHKTKAIAMNSCTSGLILTLEALDIKNLEIITPSFGFVATCQAIHYSKNHVRFVDVDDSLLLDPNKVRKVLEKDASKIGAIIPVHMYGLECHVKEFEKLGEEFGIPVIYDSAHMIGNPEAVQYGTAHIMSFSPTKLITTFEGGAVLTNCDILKTKLKLLRNYGNPPDYYTQGYGLSARMNEISALHGYYQLKKLDTYLENRNKYVEIYKRELKDANVEFQVIPQGYKNSNKDFSIFVSFPIPTEVSYFLNEDNIQTKHYFYPPLHLTEPFKHARRESLNTTIEKANSVLSLPIHNVMKESDIIKICNSVKEVLSLSRLEYIAFRKEINRK